MKKHFLFISCEEAKHICDKNQYGETSGWERVKLSIRLSWCHITRNYSKKNSKLTDIVKQSQLDCLKSEEKNKLQQQLQKELLNHK